MNTRENSSNPTSISSSSFFQEPANPKLEEIKQQLESDSINQKLEAMKRLIAVSQLISHLISIKNSALKILI